MTAQEIFDKVATHLLKQGRRSGTRDCCLYRGSKAAMCAAGCLIPDHIYDKSMEGTRALILFSRPEIASACGVNSTKALYLVQDLQEVHDVCDPDQWAEDLRLVASRFNLSPAVLG